jgi:DNA-binding beta-propeller fold protein YncE
MKRWLWTAGLGLMVLCGCGKFFTSQNGSGGTGTGTGTGTTTGNTASGDVLYVANVTASTLTGYLVSTAGALTAVSGSPYSLGEPPTSMAITPGNTFLYVGTAVGIVGYSIGTNGVLTELNGGAALVSDVLAPTGMQVDTSGNYLLAAGIDLASGTSTPEVGVYGIDTSTGLLTAQPNSPLAVAGGNGASTAVPEELYIAPNDEYVYLTLGTGGTEILSFTENGGGLGDTNTHIDLSKNGLSQTNVLANSSSTVLYVSETGAGIRGFSIGSGGALTELSGSPFTAGTGPNGMVLNSGGTALYVADKGANQISGFSVAAAGTVGALSALGSSPYAAGTEPLWLSLDQSGSFLAVANSLGSPDLGVYSFDTKTAGQLDSVSSKMNTPATGAFLVVSTHTVSGS